MSFLDRGRWRTRLAMIVATTLLGTGMAAAQQAGRPRQNAQQAPNPNAPRLETRAIPVSPNDPIATVNGQPITRRQLANECVARHGVQVLDTLIARALIDQAIEGEHLEVSASEVNAEIVRNAAAAGLNRDDFLRALSKERNLSPRQYAQQIAYPAVALRKLAEPRVEVTEEDIDKAFQAYFGEKLICRMIMVKSLDRAKQVWNKVRENPGAFERLAREHSIDQDSRAVGGLLNTPIVRYAEPLHVSKSAFEQLVDGDPDDPEHKPADGDFTGPIQLSKEAWLILKRERLEPGQDVDRDDPSLVEQMTATLRDAKLKAEMQTVMEELYEQAAIQNELTGQIKYAGNKESEVSVSDEEVLKSRMSKPEFEVPPSDEVLPELPDFEQAPPQRPVGAPEAPDLESAPASEPAAKQAKPDSD